MNNDESTFEFVPKAPDDRCWPSPENTVFVKPGPDAEEAKDVVFEVAACVCKGLTPNELAFMLACAGVELFEADKEALPKDVKVGFAKENAVELLGTDDI